jgi:ankyrin repeat protein
VALLALGEFETAEAILRQNPRLVDAAGGVLHLMTKRGDRAAVKWLLEHGANPSGVWDHWDSNVTPLHLASFANHPEIARVLLDAGADPWIRDTQHDADAMGWAEFFQRPTIAEMIATHGRRSTS